MSISTESVGLVKIWLKNDFRKKIGSKLGQRNLGRKCFFQQKKFVQKNLVKQTSWSKKNSLEKIFWLKKFSVKNKFSLKKFQSNLFLFEEILGQKNILSKIIFCT